jgi:Phosducin.
VRILPLKHKKARGDPISRSEKVGRGRFDGTFILTFLFFSPGSLINITSSEQFLSEIDSEPRHITVIAHLSSPSLPACRALNSSLAELSRSHTNVKFVSVPLGCVGDHFSATFKTSGLPAMLAYRGGEVVGNFVRLGEELGEGYFVEDVEAFLVEAGLLRAGGLPGILRPTVDDDSD